MLTVLAAVAIIIFLIGVVISLGTNDGLGPSMVVIAILLMLIWSAIPARAEEHNGHRPQDQALHEQFYSHWMMPKNRNISCCHNEDCKPSEARKIGDDWYARQEGDTGEFTKVPKDTVDIGLPDSPDSPDGRSHMCGRRYSGGWASGGFTVFCFIAGAGG